MSRAQWYEQERNDDRRIIFIVDRDTGSTSITNDADHVLSYYKIILGDDWRVVYRNTENEWWEILPAKNTFWGGGVEFRQWNGLEWDILSN